MRRRGERVCGDNLKVGVPWMGKIAMLPNISLWGCSWFSTELHTAVHAFGTERSTPPRRNAVSSYLPGTPTTGLNRKQRGDACIYSAWLVVGSALHGGQRVVPRGGVGAVGVVCVGVGCADPVGALRDPVVRRGLGVVGRDESPVYGDVVGDVAVVVGAALGTGGGVRVAVHGGVARSTPGAGGGVGGGVCVDAARSGRDQRGAGVGCVVPAADARGACADRGGRANDSVRAANAACRPCCRCR